MTRFAVWAALAASLVAAVAAGCSATNVTREEPSAGGSGPTTTANNGGSGGNAASSGGSGGALPCGVDCSTIQAPACQLAQCNTATLQCEIVPDVDGGACEDGVFCTDGDTCQAGVCVPGAAMTCGMTPGPCQSVNCNEAMMTCSFASLPNMTTCQPANNLCVSGSTCTNGLCTGGTPTDCFFLPLPNQCHVAQCDPMDGICKAVVGNNGGPCIDQQDLCTSGKTCLMGTCQGGAPTDCSTQMWPVCQQGVCNTMNGQCVAQPVTPGTQCAQATDQCNQGLCDSMGQCIPMPINQGMMCDDMNACTSGTTCNNGVCGGGMSSVTTYYSTNFATSTGWTLGAEWQIGPTMVSSGEDYGNPDPASDHTSTSDNRVAGVVLGGNAATNLHPYSYLTSPIVNTASAPTLFLDFWRWLNSDYTPYMHNVVEVYNGSTWVIVWQSGGSPGVQDAAWTRQSIDIFAHRNANMRVRFGFNIASSGVFVVSQWNVDDVVIATAICN